MPLAIYTKLGYLLQLSKYPTKKSPTSHSDFYFFIWFVQPRQFIYINQKKATYYYGGF